MRDLRHDLDPQGDTILVLRCPNTQQAVWEPKDEATKLKKKNKARRRKLFDFDSVSDTEDARCDDQNAHEPTPEAIAPSIESSTPNDSGEAHEEKSDQNEVEFRLSSRHLALASPVFKTMLNGFWKESAPLSDQSNRSAKPLSPLQNDSNCQVRYELAATEWGAEDFLLLMNIVHCQSIKVPYSIDLERLGRMSVLVDYYQCQEATQFFASLWIDKLSGSLPTTYGRDCVTWIFVSWVFSRSNIFEKMTQVAIRTCEGGLGTINLPFPPMLLSMVTPHLHDLSKLMCFAAVMEQKRDHFITMIFALLGLTCKHLREGRRGCDFECTSMLLGSLLRGMDKNELYGACSAERAKSAVLSLKSGTRYVCTSVYSGIYSAHPCTLHALLQPGMEKLWNRLDGLELNEYNGQKKKSADVPTST
ncbi:hypothetical protein E4U40_002062 [Claviceps sp. LM458 group G5]|nr:hypothetical protein E4U40_002062 [Claviceps sp. LM458 group G5]